MNKVNILIISMLSTVILNSCGVKPIVPKRPMSPLDSVNYLLRSDSIYRSRKAYFDSVFKELNTVKDKH